VYEASQNLRGNSQNKASQQVEGNRPQQASQGL